MEFPTLETERTKLRQISIEDAPAFFRIYSDAESMKFRETPPTKSIEEAEIQIAKYQHDFREGISMRWAIEFKETNTFIGSVVWKIAASQHEFGYSLDKMYWRRGIMSEVLEAVLHYLFHSVQLPFVTARTKTGNTASQQLLEKLGFELMEKTVFGVKYKLMNNRQY